MDSIFPLWTFYLAVMLAAAVEVAANLLLAKSDGFRKLAQGFGSLLLVAVAFSLLAYAVRGMDLAVAYAMWGSFGILGTSVGGWLLFKQRLKPAAWLGIVLLIGGVVLMNI